PSWILRGRSEAEVVALAEERWESTMAQRIFPDAPEAAEEHLQAGHSVWLVTAAPVQLAQGIARALGFTGALGTVAEVSDGRYTGDRKSTRLNSSHVSNSYAVFCLKKKIKAAEDTIQNRP